MRVTAEERRQLADAQALIGTFNATGRRVTEATVLDLATGGRIFLRGKTLWLDYSVRGQRIKESTRTGELGAAKAKLAERMGGKATGAVVNPKAEKVRFSELAQMVRDDYTAEERKSKRRLELSLRHLTEFFGMYRAIDITDDRVTAYKVYRQEAGASQSSIQKEVAALKRGFRLAKKANRITIEPEISGVKVGKSNARKGFFTSGDLEKLIPQLPEHLKPVARFAYCTGWRKGEILALEWSAVDTEAGVITLAGGTTKNDEPRQTPFRSHPDLVAVIADQRAAKERTEKATGQIVRNVFHRSGKAIRSMDGAWRAACERAGLGGWLFHDMRRSAVRNLERAGVGRSIAKSFTGHTTDSVYERYAIVDSVAQKEGMEKLATLHAQDSKDSKDSKVLPFKKASGE